MSADQLTSDAARKFSSLALAHVQREYPNLLYHVLNGPADVRSPRALHPVFFGSMDWHSCVHGYWLLATLRRGAMQLMGLGILAAAGVWVVDSAPIGGFFTAAPGFALALLITMFGLMTVLLTQRRASDPVEKWRGF